MIVHTVTFSSPNYLYLAAGLWLAGLIVIAYAYRRTHGPLRWACAGLKAAALTALALCLLEPLWIGQRARQGANLFAIVADNSQGMQVKASADAETRAKLLRGLLDPGKSPWQDKMARDFELRRYMFDSRLQPVSSFEALDFQGRSTALRGALQTISERFRGRPLAGVLLLTDGNATDMRGLPDVTGWPAIYPVVPGGDEPVTDLSVQQVLATQTAFEDAPVSVQADVLATGSRGQLVMGQLRDAAGKLAAEETVRVRKDPEQLAFRFQIKPQGPGVHFYRFEARFRDEIDAANVDRPSAEATLLNNRSVVAVDRGRGPYRILYVAGRPNWDFKFLNRAVEEDPQLELVALIRVARREPKFTFLGRAGETSNPLFRGFGNQSPEEIERYDQPVLVRLNTRDENELRGGFPRTAEEMFSYDAVVLDDVEAEFFKPDQASLLQRFVSERGGGMVMLGGAECFGEGNYQRTPIGDMLPVYLTRVAIPTNAEGVRLDFTRDGWLQAWARLRDNETDERTRLKAMPGFQVLNPVQDIKPGASVILTASDSAGQAYPALVIQRFGHGRTAALTVGDLWRWGMQDADLQSDLGKAWRQTMRWLVNETPARVQLLAETKADDPAGAVGLSVRVRERDFKPSEDARVSIEIMPALLPDGSNPDTNVLRLAAEPSPTEPGLYQALFVPRAAGGYRATAIVTNAAGLEEGRPMTGWSSDLAVEEFRSLSPNRKLLEDLARKTGGEVIDARRLNAFAAELPKRAAPVMEASASPLWHTPAMFAFALASMIAEWGLRRWKGLP